MGGGWRKLINEEHLNLCSQPNIIIIIKLKRTRWTEHAVSMGKERNACRNMVGMPKRKKAPEEIET